MQEQLFSNKDLENFNSMQELVQKHDSIEIIEWNLDSCKEYLFEQFDPEFYHELESSGIIQSMNGDTETIGIIYENYTLQIRMNSITEIIDPSGQEAKTNTENIEISLLMNSENNYIEQQERELSSSDQEHDDFLGDY